MPHIFIQGRCRNPRVLTLGMVSAETEELGYPCPLKSQVTGGGNSTIPFKAVLLGRGKGKTSKDKYICQERKRQHCVQPDD